MNILCIANDIPIPANSGGRVDVWRRLCAFKEAGHRVTLICWVDVGRVTPPDKETLDKIYTVCTDFIWLPITRSLPEILKRTINLWRFPSHVASRYITADKTRILNQLQGAHIDLIWLDGLYGGALALHLSDVLKIPVWYRSHNIEHKYMQDQLTMEKRLMRRIGLAANCFGLERFERHVISKAKRVFDISLSDAEFWREKGANNKIQWLPTLIDNTFAQALDAPIQAGAWDLCYFGNLNTPNNIQSVRWLIDQVLPHIENEELKIVIAGSNPTSSVHQIISTDKRIELIENPKDMATIITRARVLVNPMQAGSGVNLKSVEMLFTQASLISTSVGVAGLSRAAKACFSIADSPIDFAQSIKISLIKTPNLDERVEARKDFSLEAMHRIFS